MSRPQTAVFKSAISVLERCKITCALDFTANVILLYFSLTFCNHVVFPDMMFMGLDSRPNSSIFILQSHS